MPPACTCRRYVAAACLVLINVVGGMVIEGLLEPQSSYELFVGKFCYDYWAGERAVGELKVNITRDEPSRIERQQNDGNLYLMVFSDQRSHWKSIRQRWDVSSCEEKKQAASIAVQVNHISQDLQEDYVILITQHIRPRFWYFTFVSCDGRIRLDAPLRYRLHMTNEMWGWQGELSLEQIGLFTVYAIFTVLFSLASLVLVMLTREDHVRRDHPYVQLLMLSVISSASSSSCFVIHYWVLMSNGIGSQRVHFLGVCSGIVANSTIFLIAILSSSGWAISRSRLNYRRAFFSAVSLVGLTNAICELRAEVTLDVSTKLYSYQSALGVLGLIFKVFMFCWFAFQIQTTYREETHELKRRFYKYLGISIALWFICVPVSVLLAFMLSPWYRYKVVTTVDVIARFFGQVFLLQLFCGPLSPISPENSFPAEDDIRFGRLDDGISLNQFK